MSIQDTVLLCYAAVVTVAVVLTLYRMIVGPTILDRAVAADMLTVLLVIGIGLFVVRSGELWPVPAMLALTALAFVSSVSVARFTAREDPRHPPRPGGAEPPTVTAAHEAIHPDRGHALRRLEATGGPGGEGGAGAREGGEGPDPRRTEGAS